MVERERLYPLFQDGRLSQYVMVSRYEHPELLFMLQKPVHTGIPVLDQVKKSDGRHYNYNNLQMAAVNRYYMRDAIEVIRTFPASYVHRPDHLQPPVLLADQHERVLQRRPTARPCGRWSGSSTRCCTGWVPARVHGTAALRLRRPQSRSRSTPRLPLIALWCVLLALRLLAGAPRRSRSATR